MRLTCLSWCADNHHKHHHQYSIGRLRFFDEYRIQTSQKWMILVCFFTPMLGIFFLGLCNWVVPLEPVTKGWQLQWGFYLRAFLSSLFGTYGLQLQLKFYLPSAQITWKQDFFISFMTSVVYVASGISFCATIFFPLPFALLWPVFLALPSYLFLVRFMMKYNDASSQATIQSQGIGMSLSHQVHPENQFQGKVSGLHQPQEDQNRCLRLSYKTSAHEREVSGRQDKRQQEIRSLFKVILFECALIYVYPFVGVGFRRLDKYPLYQACYALILPLLHFVSEKIALRIFTNSAEDLAAESTVFTASFFNSLFCTMCLTSSLTSIYSGIAIITVDILHILYCTYSFHKRSSKLMFTQAKRKGHWTIQSKKDIILECIYIVKKLEKKVEGNLMTINQNLRWETSNRLSFRRSKLISQWFGRRILNNVKRQFSSKIGNINRKRTTTTTTNTATTTTTNNATSIFPNPTSASNCCIISSTISMTPITPSSAPAFASRGPIQGDITTKCLPDHFNRVPVAQETKEKTIVAREEEDIVLLTETLGILFDMERLVLMEYIEIMIPFVYGVYVVTTYFSPCKDFITGVSELTESTLLTTIYSMLSYIIPEILSIFLLYYLVKRKFQVNVFHLLAFVTEIHFFSIQGKMFFFISVVLNFNLQHSGMDFGFEFAWLHNNNSTTTTT